MMYKHLNDGIILSLTGVSYNDETKMEKVEDISFDLECGKNLVIFGPEKSGKDFILPLITGKIKPDSGNVILANRSVSEARKNELEEIRKSIGYVTGRSGLINNLSVRENILLPLRYHTQMPEEEMLEKADSLIRQYGLKKRENDRPQKLIASEILRVVFARALILKPALILADNAFDGHCPLSLAHFLEIAEKDIVKDNISFIISTYMPTVASGYGNRFLMLYEGKIVFDGNSLYTSNAYVEQYLRHPLSGPMNFRQEEDESK